MADPRFFSCKGPLTIAALSEIAGARMQDGADPSLMMHDVAPLETAGPADISFFDNVRYVDVFRKSRAGACLVRSDRVDGAPAGMTLLVSGRDRPRHRRKPRR